MKLKLFVNKVFRKLFFKKLVFIKKRNNNKEALIYYKTDSLYFRPFKIEFHTNLIEINLIIKILLSKGFNLTVVDRSASKKIIEKLLSKNYDLLLTSCAGNSSPFTAFIQENIKAKKVIAYAAGPDPNISNNLVFKRHNDCKERLNYKNFFTRRFVKGEVEELKSRFIKSDYIFCLGKEFSLKTYSQYKKKMFGINPTISTNLDFNLSDISNKNPKRLIYFGGNGAICKGLDLVIDSILEIGKSHEIYLDIFGPGYKKSHKSTFIEEDFWNYYSKVLKNCSFIKVHGFVPIGSKLFLEKTLNCSFNIFPTASEGCATSVITCMRRAIIPVVNYEAGINNVEDFGILLKSNKFNDVKKTIEKCISMSQEEVEELSLKTYLESWKYSPEIYSKEFSDAIDTVLKDLQK